VQRGEANICFYADPHHVDAGPDPACHFDADQDQDPTFHSDAIRILASK
jgi:hypothetical protein